MIHGQFSVFEIMTLPTLLYNSLYDFPDVSNETKTWFVSEFTKRHVLLAASQAKNVSLVSLLRKSDRSHNTIAMKNRKHIGSLRFMLCFIIVATLS